MILAAGNAFAATHHSGESVHGHGAESAGGPGLPQFDPTWFASQIFWLVVTFFILFLFFSRKTLPVISGVLENRRDHIQGDLDTADRLTREAEDVQHAYESSLERARIEAVGVITDTEMAMNVKAMRAFESFRERTDREMAATEARIKKAKAEVLARIDHIAAEVAIDVIAKLSGGRGASHESALALIEKLTKEEQKGVI